MENIKLIKNESYFARMVILEYPFIYDFIYFSYGLDY